MFLNILFSLKDNFCCGQKTFFVNFSLQNRYFIPFALIFFLCYYAVGTFNKLGDLPSFKTKGGDNMKKKDLLIFALVVIIFLLILLLFVVLM